MNVAATMRYVLIGVGLWSGTAAAELTIIYDSGRTQSLAPYLAAFSEDPPTESAAAPSEIPLGAADLSQLLPIRTPELTPGTVTTRPLSLPDGVALPRPFFLIGADPRSLEWLARHRELLAEINAVGMLVQAETADDLEATAAIAQGLPILPASATDIAQSMGLRHIPVLISGRGIEQ